MLLFRFKHPLELPKKTALFIQYLSRRMPRSNDPQVGEQLCIGFICYSEVRIRPSLPKFRPLVRGSSVIQQITRDLKAILNLAEAASPFEAAEAISKPAPRKSSRASPRKGAHRASSSGRASPEFPLSFTRTTELDPAALKSPIIVGSTPLAGMETQ